MSETITDPVPETPEPAPVPLPSDAPPTSQTDAPSELGAGADPEPTPDPAPEPKPRRADRHVANLTARLAAKEAEAAAAERRAAAAEALLNAGRSDEPPPPRAPQVDREAVKAEIRFDERRQSLVAEGTKEFGADEWNAKTSILHGLGATTNPAFMEALVELPNAAKVVAHLAEDSDELMALLGKSPIAMATALARLDNKMDTPATKPPVSNAPRPPAPIKAAAVEAEPDIYDPRLSMKEWAALWDKQAPRHLGGKRG